MTNKLKDDAILINLKRIADQLEAMEARLDKMEANIASIQRQVQELNYRQSQQTRTIAEPLEPWTDKTVYPTARGIYGPYAGTPWHTGNGTASLNDGGSVD